MGTALFALVLLAGAAFSMAPEAPAEAQQGSQRPPDMLVRSFVPRVAVDNPPPPEGSRNAPGTGAGVGSGGSNSCPAIIYEALGEAGCMISFCESGWNANATGGAGEMGWFQVSPVWHADATYDPAGNVAAAVRISRGGTDWSAWTVTSVLQTGVCPTGVPYPA